MERVIDRSYYRRCNSKTKNIKKLSYVSIFFNQIIIVMTFILLALVMKINNNYYYSYISKLCAEELNKGIPFEKIKSKIFEIYNDVVFENVASNSNVDIMNVVQRLEFLYKNNLDKDDVEIIDDIGVIEDVKFIELSQYEKDVKEIKEKYDFIKPIEGVLTSSFGKRESFSTVVSDNHKGTDIAAPLGTLIKASHYGEVIYAGVLESYGNCIVIEQGKLKTLYAHCSKLLVEKGQKVEKGTNIAEVGSTGNSTGYHLHYEIRYEDRFVDSEDVISWQ